MYKSFNDPNFIEDLEAFLKRCGLLDYSFEFGRDETATLETTIELPPRSFVDKDDLPLYDFIMSQKEKSTVKYMFRNSPENGTKSE